MNEDHADAVLLYAQVYGNTATAISAAMLKIDAQGMDLLARNETSEIPVRVTFDHELQDAKEAHHVLVEMMKQARQNANA
jgi:putative heme iron utilization protein